MWTCSPGHALRVLRTWENQLGFHPSEEVWRLAHRSGVKNVRTRTLLGIMTQGMFGTFDSNGSWNGNISIEIITCDTIPKQFHTDDKLINKNMNGWKEIPLSKAKIYYRESGMDRSNDYVEDGLRLDFFFSQYGPVQPGWVVRYLGAPLKYPEWSKQAWLWTYLDSPFNVGNLVFNRELLAWPLQTCLYKNIDTRQIINKCYETFEDWKAKVGGCQT